MERNLSRIGNDLITQAPFSVRSLHGKTCKVLARRLMLVSEDKKPSLGGFVKYKIWEWVFLLSSCTSKAMQPQLIDLQASLQNFAKAIPTKLEKVFSEKFIKEIYDAIHSAKYKDKTFTLRVTKASDQSPKRKLSEPAKCGIPAASPLDPFCDVIEGRGPARMMWADKKYIAMFSRNEKKHMQETQKTESTVLVIPQNHVRDITEVTLEQLQEIFEICAHVAGLFGNPDRYLLTVNRGSTNAHVQHLHVHLTMYYDEKQLKTPLWDQVKNKQWDGKPFRFVAEYQQARS